MEAEFRCKTKDLRRVIKLIKQGQPRRRAYKKRLITIVVRKNKIEILTPGKIYPINAKCSEQAIVKLPQYYLESIIKTYKEQDFTCKVEDGKVAVGQTESYIPDIKAEVLKDDSDLNDYMNKLQKIIENEIDLTINYSDRELLWIKNKYKIEELEKNKIIDRIYDAQLRKDDNLKKTYNLLKIYGITKYDLNKLVDGYIENTEF